MNTEDNNDFYDDELSRSLISNDFEDDTPHRKKKSKKPLVICLIILLIAAAAGGTAWYMMQRHKPVEATEEFLTGMQNMDFTTMENLLQTASGGQSLIAMKIVECEEKGLSFEEVVSEVEKYIEEMNTFFVLENLETLRKNGRLGRVKALVASALKIKPVMGATPEGTICQLDQARGMNKAIVKMVDHIGEKGINIPEKTVAITHCNCPERAKMLEEAIREKLHPAKIVVMDTAGVSSMYANDGGVIVAV